MKKIKIILSSCIALTITTNCFADLPPCCGWYVEGNAGLTKVSNTNYGTGITLTNNGRFGVNLNVGYKFMPFFAAEGGLTQYTPEKIKSSLGGSATATNTALDIAGKAILPLGLTGTEIFTKIGVAAVSSKISLNKNTAGLTVANGTHTGTSFYLGAGAEYAFSSSTMVVGQWARAKGNSTTGTYDLFSIGVSYTFGSGGFGF